MTTVGTMTATRTAAASGEIESEDLATVADGGDAAVPLESLVSLVLVTEAARRKSQQLLQMAEKLWTCLSQKLASCL